jgi:protein-tyrosine phosphatase
MAACLCVFGTDSQAEQSIRRAVVNRGRSPNLGTVWNFRDLGGYATSKGEITRFGLVFRSGDLHDLNNEDASALASLGLRTVLDLRDRVASERSPNRLNDPSVRQLSVDLSTSVLLKLRDRLRTGYLSESESLAFIRANTAAIATERAEDIKAVFRCLARSEAFPLLVHCSFGKDRTGIVAALLLFALGVPEETIYADYMLSNDYLVEFRAARIAKPGWEHTGPLWEARREYLDGAFSAICDQYGSIGSYLQDAIGLTDERRTELKARLLYKPD